MLPFSNLRAVILHRLSPSAFYKEDFCYSVSCLPGSGPGARNYRERCLESLRVDDRRVVVLCPPKRLAKSAISHALTGQVPRDVRLLCGVRRVEVRSNACFSSSAGGSTLPRPSAHISSTSSAPQPPTTRPGIWPPLPPPSKSLASLIESPSLRRDEQPLRAKSFFPSAAATLVWIQTSVFVHYQHLSTFALNMPPSWSLERR